MQIIALISQKGGAGKTTLAIAIAVTAEREGLTSVLVDLDPQASAAQWSDLREAETPVVTCTPAVRLASVLAAAQDAGAGLAVLDTAPHAAEAALAAARASNFVLIPCRPATADLVAIGASIDLIRIADKPGAVVINAAPRRQSAHVPSAHRHRRLRHGCLPRRRASENRARPRLHVRIVRSRICTERQGRSRDQ